MKTLRYLLAISMVIMAVVVSGCGQNKNVGVIDVEKVVTESPKIKVMNEELMAKHKEIEEKLNTDKTTLSEADFKQILTEPANSLIKQYQAMLMAENVKITFKLEAIEELAKMAHKVNEQMENIGARRLYTMLEKLLEDLSFEAPELSGTTVIIDQQYVKDKLGHIIIDEDLSRFIL